MARDEFPPKVISNIQRRVAARCSNPNCRVPTMAGGQGVLAVVNIGIAAHVHAASPGGPRYLASMSRDDRRGEANAIWLCSNCSILIDRDEGAYPPELLRRWKDEAEDRARAELGNKLPDARDALDHVVAVVSGQAPRHLPALIANAHRATELALERLDPRFRVTSAFSQGTTHFHLAAQEAVTFTVQIGARSAQAWTEGLRAVMEHGRAAMVPMQDVSLCGSDLLRAIAQDAQAGSLKISPLLRPAAVRLSVAGSVGCAGFSETIPGALAPGQKTVRFEGAGLGGLVRMEVDVQREGTLHAATMALQIDFDPWAGMDVRSIGHLDRLVRLLEGLVQYRAQIQIALEVEGNDVLSSVGVGAEDSPAFESYLNFAKYVQRSRTVASALGLVIPVALDAPFTGEQHAQLAEVAHVFEKRWKYKDSDIERPPTFRLVTPGDGGEVIEKAASKVFCSLMVVAPPETIRIFNADVLLPSLRLILEAAQMVVRSKRRVARGTRLDIATSMKDGSHMFMTYEDIPPTVDGLGTAGAGAA